MRSKIIIHDALAKALTELDIESSFSVDHPADFSHGDYASGVALAAAKKVGISPRALAEKIVVVLGKVDGVEKIEIAGPGFINFTLEGSAVAESIASPERKVATSFSRRKILMEYTDPNPFKEFHIGHLVPNAIGEAVSRILAASGAEVKRANYQGDVGIHVAKSLFIQMEKGITEPTIEILAKSYPEGSTRYDTDPEAKKAIDALNKTIYEKSDTAVNELYEKGRSLSLQHFEELYAILGTKFDFYFFESATGPLGLEIVKAHPEIFPESEGAVIFKGEEYGLHTRVFVNKVGLPTYEAKELGLYEMKTASWDFDETITVTATEQADYFRVVLKAMSLVFPESATRASVITNGLLRFAEGKMSSRLGNVITGESLLRDVMAEAAVRAKDSRADDPEKLAQEIAVGAIKYQILKQSVGKDIIFDRERALSLEGDSGPYLQYAHARTCALLEKGKTLGETPQIPMYDATRAPSILARHLARFSDVIEHAAEEREPHHLATFLIETAAAFNSWYAAESILNTEDTPHKLGLVLAVQKTLAHGLALLGISAPSKM